jgi:hypothetical protein
LDESKRGNFFLTEEGGGKHQLVIILVSDIIENVVYTVGKGIGGNQILPRNVLKNEVIFRKL